MEFSSTYGGTESLPVTGFTFQEPENDPRNFCYLWTMQGRTEVDNAAILSSFVAAFEGFAFTRPCLASCQILLNHLLSFKKIATHLLNTAERERLRDARGEVERELAGRGVAARAQLRPPRRGGPVRRSLLGTPLLPGQ